MNDDPEPYELTPGFLAYLTRTRPQAAETLRREAVTTCELHPAAAGGRRRVLSFPSLAGRPMCDSFDCTLHSNVPRLVIDAHPDVLAESGFPGVPSGTQTTEGRKALAKVSTSS